MAVVEPTPTGLHAPSSYMDFAPIIGGALIASAISLILFQFGSGIGLAISAPLADDYSNGYLGVFAISIWLFWVPLVSAMAGGYVAGRMRAPIAGSTEHEVEMRDGAHGLVVWALSTLLAAVGVALVSAIVAHGGEAVTGASATQQTEDMARVAANSGIIFTFATGAGGAIAAALAWWAATLGGEHRDKGITMYQLAPFGRK